MRVRPNLSADVNKRFTEWQAYRPEGEAIAAETKAAVGNVVQALAGVASEEEIIAAVERARSPNAVSRAVRSRLPPL